MSSIALPETGLYVMSSSERKLQAVIDAGPQGALRAGHGHADSLSLTVHAEEFELFGDPGTYEYVSAGTERDQFRGTAAHNTLQFDRRNQSDPKGPFAWQRLTKATTEGWITGENFDFFVGSHDGYSLLENPAIHRRWVFFRKPRFWLVRDLMLGTGKHQLDLRWHLNPELSSLESSRRPVLLVRKKRRDCLIFPNRTKLVQDCGARDMVGGIWNERTGNRSSIHDDDNTSCRVRHIACTHRPVVRRRKCASQIDAVFTFSRNEHLSLYRQSGRSLLYIRPRQKLDV